MRFTKIGDLALAAVVAGVVVNLLLRLAYGTLPPLPTLAGAPFLILAVVELILGFNLRARIQRKPGTQPVQPLAAARALALAKASSLVGAIMVGVWLGALGYLLPQRSALLAAAKDSVSAFVGLVCSAALIGAALWLEYCCKAPKPPEDDDEK